MKKEKSEWIPRMLFDIASQLTVKNNRNKNGYINGEM